MKPQVFLSLILIIASSVAFAQTPSDAGQDFEAFKKNVYPIIHGMNGKPGQCVQCHSAEGPGPNHSGSDPYMSYKNVLGYTNFGNLNYSKFIVRATNGHWVSYMKPGDTAPNITKEELVAAFQKWWNEGENTSFLVGKKVLKSQNLPRLSDDGTFAEMTWDLGELDQSMSGTKFVVEIQRYMKKGEMNSGAYRIKNPRFETKGSQNVGVQGIHIVINGAYDALANDFSTIKTIATSDQSVSQNMQIVLERQGDMKDQLSFAFEKIGMTTQTPPAQTAAVSQAKQSKASIQSSLEAFNESKVGISARFVPIKTPVDFEMGSPPSVNGYNETLHVAHLKKPFDIQVTDVTQLQWYMVMKDSTMATPSNFKTKDSCDPGQYLEIKEKNASICKDHPVEQVSWDDIQIFLKKLNDSQADYTYALPTEAQWEYVAKAGLPTEYAYGFGNDFDGNYAWFSGNSNNRTHKVASKEGIPSPSNPADLIYDMHGNVWQWCQDWYGDYPSNSPVDYAGPQSGSYRVVRGGSWFSVPRDVRSARRGYGSSFFRNSDIGFRLVRTAR